jgi:hypothetical protein
MSAQVVTVVMSDEHFTCRPVFLICTFISVSHMYIHSLVVVEHQPLISCERRISIPYRRPSPDEAIIETFCTRTFCDPSHGNIATTDGATSSGTSSCR